jgi:phosphoribosylformylglycinamidine synthase subunit PurSL
MIQEVRVVRRDADPDGQQLLRDVHAVLGLKQVTDVRTVRVYRLEGSNEKLSDLLAQHVLCESINQEYSLNRNRELVLGALGMVEVGYKPGVMNPEAASLLKVAREMDIDLLAADSSTEYHFFGQLTGDELQLILDRLLVNKTVQQVVERCPQTLLMYSMPVGMTAIPLTEMTDEDMIRISKQRQLFLNLCEMQVIQEYFRRLGRYPTDAEIETLAQTWSEHCRHKTFTARLIVNGKEKLPLMTRLKTTAAKYDRNVISSFEDNSGVVYFYDGYGVAAKVETHNSPSAIEPYGGAMTGTGGVVRDIMGTGQGIHCIASTDMFCFAPPNLPTDELPPGCLHPDYLFRRVVAGVRDYGNRMGIPTNNGSVTFHNDFRAKPSVIVGAYGLALERFCHKSQPQAGDRIVAVGGRTGRDGIHGATFSSGEMTAQTVTVNATAVQIGNAIEEKRMADVLLSARDLGYIRAITDCGAGGFSSAVGEMGIETGARIYLDRAPLKYPGLAPWEIWISESQERMICAIPPQHVSVFVSLCESYNVEATELGEFTDDRLLTVLYEGDAVCELSMDFLHNGLPQRTMVATKSYQEHVSLDIPLPTDWLKLYCQVLGHLDVCSKELIVRQYDHGVQGTNVLPPFSGVHCDGPNDAVVLTPLLGKPYGLVISHGMNPRLMRLGPYNGALWALTEALANLVAVGGDVRQAALIDNFIWPFPDEYCLGALDAAVDGCVDGMHLFAVPFISGKDSLSSTYRYPSGEILEIPPVLCVSAVGRIPDIDKTVTADFKRPGSQIVFLGCQDIFWPASLQPAMHGSVYYSIQAPDSETSCHDYFTGRIPMVDRNRSLRHMFIRIYEQIMAGNILACHDISQGGLATTLAEMCFGGGLGATINLSVLGCERPDFLFFNETAGCFVVEIPDSVSIAEVFPDIPYRVLGNTVTQPLITLWHEGSVLFSAPLPMLKQAWQAPMQEVFGS